MPEYLHPAGRRGAGRNRAAGDCVQGHPFVVGWHPAEIAPSVVRNRHDAPHRGRPDWRFLRMCCMSAAAAHAGRDPRPHDRQRLDRGRAMGRDDDSDTTKTTPKPESSAPKDSDAAERRDDSATAEELAKSADFDHEMKEAEEAGEDTEELRRSYLLRRFWQAAAGFWGRRGRRIAWILSAALLVIILLHIAASYAMNLWNRAIFDALEKKDAATVLFLSLVYFALLAASVTVNVGQVYARMTLQRRWRKWLTDNLVDRWLTGGRYYQLNLV